MRLRVLAAPVLTLVGCGPKEIPPHLRPDRPVESGPTASPPTSLAAAAEQLVGADPLARRARPHDDGWWLGVDESAPIVAWSAVARVEQPSAVELWDIDRAHPGTIAAPLAAGARLASLEVVLAQTPGDGEVLRPTLPWLAPVTMATTPLPAAARGPLEWLVGPGGAPRAAALATAERTVLAGWLSAPGVPAAAAAGTVKPGVHDRLVQTPMGALLMARTRGATDPDARGEAQAKLAAATSLALLGAAADRDIEQAAFAQAKEDARSGEDDRDPVARLLTEARTAALRDAATDTSVAVALTAHVAERLRGSCPDEPCGGVDRLQTLSVADTWSETPEAALWRVIAAKRVLDTLDVARDRPSFAASVDELADLLIGQGASTVPERLLRARRPDEAVWLAVARGLGVTDATQWEDARAALAAHVVVRCDEALARDLVEADRDAITRIRRRATP